MHIGVKVPNWGPLAGPEALVRTAQVADVRGFDSVWVSDHVAVPRAATADYPYSASARPPFDPQTPFVEAIVALAHLAAVTNRVQLGTGVLVLPLRHPVLVAKQTASLDVLSRGRLVLGVGVGWLADEFAVLGRPFTSRGRQTDEGIRTLRACWSGQELHVNGRSTLVAMYPRPVRAVPVLVGGHSAAALRRAATHGDGWYGSNISAGEFGVLVARLRALPGGADLTVGARPGVVAPEDAAAVVRAFSAAGADFVVLDAPYGDLDADGAAEWVHRVADVLPLDEGSQPLTARAVSEG
jgi:probable F420-dependent oxidoreductase